MSCLFLDLSPSSYDDTPGREHRHPVPCSGNRTVTRWTSLLYGLERGFPVATILRLCNEGAHIHALRIIWGVLRRRRFPR